MDDGLDTREQAASRPAPQIRPGSEHDPEDHLEVEPESFEGVDVAVLDDANEALRFIESTMSMEESQTFISSVGEAEPGLADRLRRMRDDHRLLRTTALDESVHGRDLLGPVRGQLARGELVIDDDGIPSGGVEPTGLMEQSVRHIARRRRRARRRPYEIAAFIGIGCTAIGLFIGARLESPAAQSGTAPVASAPVVESEISSFALAMPASDPISTESAMHRLATSRNIMLVRNGAVGEEDFVVGRGPTSRRDGLPPRRVRADLARRGFDYALVVPREDVSSVVAAVGEMMGGGGLDSAPRLLPSDAVDPTQAIGQNAWNGWSQQPNIARAMSGDAPYVVVPIAVFPSD